MSQAYLEEAYQFDVDMLIEPIRKASVARQIFPFMTTLSPSDLEVQLIDVEDDLNIAVSQEPLESPRSVNALNRNKYATAVIHGEVSYAYDELVRIEGSELPMNERVALMGYQLAQVTDGLIFAQTSTGVRDGDHQPLMENGTSFSFDLDDYTTARNTVGEAIGTINENVGNIQQYPLDFLVNDKSFKTLLQQHNANTDNSAMTAIQEMLQMFGAPGSGIRIVPRLGCTISESNGVVSIQNATTETAALVSVNPQGFSLHDSPLDDRPDLPFNKRKGFNTQIVQRLLGRVHKAHTIQFDDDATP